MSRRLQNRARIATALARSLEAEAWLGPPRRAPALQAITGGHVAPWASALMATQPRVQRRLGDITQALYCLLRDYPELGRWLESPTKLQRLACYVGAAQWGTSLRAFIERADIEILVVRLGEPVWRFGAQRGGGGLMLTRDAHALAERIIVDGHTRVACHLVAVAPEVYRALLAATDESSEPGARSYWPPASRLAAGAPGAACPGLMALLDEIAAYVDRSGEPASAASLTSLPRRARAEHHQA